MIHEQRRLGVIVLLTRTGKEKAGGDGAFKKRAAIYWVMSFSEVLAEDKLGVMIT